jgi:hypothetical protein
MQFTTTIELGGKTATGMQVPAEVVEALGAGKRPPVKVTLNGYTYRSTVAAYGELFMLPVSKEVRVAAGVAAGDQVEVGLVLDTEPRAVVVPPDFAEAIAADPEASRFFESLSYSNKRRLVIGVDEAKTAETRQRRIAKSVSMLREGRVS